MLDPVMRSKTVSARTAAIAGIVADTRPGSVGPLRQFKDWMLFRLMYPAKKHNCFGVELWAAEGGDSARESALANVEAALTLIRRVRPWDLLRIQRLVRRIVVRKGITEGGSWDDASRTIFLTAHWMLEASQWGKIEPDAYAAATIIHEAMHARIRELGITSYASEADRLREELLCNRAALLFARRVGGAESLTTMLCRQRERWQSSTFSNDAYYGRGVDEMKHLAGGVGWRFSLFVSLFGAATWLSIAVARGEKRNRLIASRNRLMAALKQPAPNDRTK